MVLVSWLAQLLSKPDPADNAKISLCKAAIIYVGSLDKNVY